MSSRSEKCKVSGVSISEYVVYNSQRFSKKKGEKSHIYFNIKMTFTASEIWGDKTNL